MNTLLCNLTRFGDLLQTQPVIHGLAERGVGVGLLCLENFAPATRLLSDLDYVCAFPGSRVLSLMDKDWKDALGFLDEFKTSLRQEFPFDDVFNLTATMPVRLLTRFLSMGHVEGGRGFLLDDFGFSVSDNPWVSFLLASSKRRGVSPFNLVDLFWKVSGLPDAPRRFALKSPGPEDTQAAAELLRQSVEDFGTIPESDNRYVALQMGASVDRRRWPVPHFAELAAALHAETGRIPVLLGAKGEAALGERFQKLYADMAPGAPLVSCIGKTNLTELAAVLLACDLLVSNDTGTMHLAAGLGVPVAAVFLATAQPWDTGPYRAGNVCLEPAMDCHPCAYGSECPRDEACRRAVGPRLMADLVRTRLETGAWPENMAQSGGTARIWETVSDDHHFMDLRSLSGHDSEDRTRWLRIQRETYRHLFDNGVFEAADLERIKKKLDAHNAATLSPGNLAQLQAELTQAAQLFMLLTQQGRALASAPIESLKGKFLATFQRIQHLLESSEHLSVLGYLFASNSQEAGRDLDSILALTARYAACVDALTRIVHS
ncbi:glycosyltransferase family 9 protein [Oceanidesulfovibrio marinus]|uniref:Glycosyltransferase family 9 protein n=1 Tax=Oceanidesulfovibrio marinus TaxID=370038 RepID=A0ABX6NJQ9_9BACT|nr:glycosyltransferase family 9 protein [Oceanidesulfovibrio marinus]QJT09957.1 glycosyltransferase family 9 protein [Oceanidesulfovibrio marinus]